MKREREKKEEKEGEWGEERESLSPSPFLFPAVLLSLSMEERVSE